LGFTSSARGTSKQNCPSFRTYGGGKISGVVAILPSSNLFIFEYREKKKSKD
jgi:hypothetical protein